MVTIGKLKLEQYFPNKTKNLAASITPTEMDSILEGLLPYRPLLRNAMRKKYTKKNNKVNK